jgi:putative endonuclease
MARQYGGYVYITTNPRLTVLYTGVTSSLYHRILEHKQHFYKGSFTDTYNAGICIFYEWHSSIEEAIAREKQIKKWRREKKVRLIKSFNPEWKDLWDEIELMELGD